MGVIEDFYSHFIWTIDEKSCCSYETVSCREMGLASLDLSDNSACSKINFVLINSFINIGNRCSGFSVATVIEKNRINDGGLTDGRTQALRREDASKKIPCPIEPINE